jgi:hypothetical protein
VEAEHGIVCTRGSDRFGYFGWPSLARMDDGTLVVAASGLRTRHVCPWGKTVLCTSVDGGVKWSEPEVLNDTPLDDRDAGVVCLGGSGRLVSFFTSDTRARLERWGSRLDDAELAEWRRALAGLTDELVDRWLGSWVRVSADGQTWSDPIRVDVTAPHGPIRLRNGELLYLGKYDPGSERDRAPGEIRAIKSSDGGRSWSPLGAVPLGPGLSNENLHEPHAVELPSGRLIGLIRYEQVEGSCAFEQFSLIQTESHDGGRTWSEARSLGVYGSPPHLLWHSSGAIVCAYGYRKPPYGQRAMVSRDEGVSWEPGLVLREAHPDDPGRSPEGLLQAGDLGYPASVELPGGEILTIYYQRLAPDEHPSILWTRWSLPQ